MPYGMRRAAAAGILVGWGLIEGCAVRAQGADSTERASRIHLIGEARRVMDTVMTRARRRLARPECQALFTDFVDRDGHTLAAILGESGRTAAEYLGDLYFVEANTSAQCRRRPPLIAYTAAKGRVVYLCTGRFVAYFSKKTSASRR